MEHAVEQLARAVGLLLEMVAVLVIIYGSLAALVGIVQLILKRGATDADKRTVWLHFMRWLVAALSFQLAADIVHTSVAPTWDEVGRLGAIALIRTFLTYFLDKDVERVAEAKQS